MSETQPQDTPRQEEDTGKVNLVSMDGDSFEVARSVAGMSELVKTLIAGKVEKRRRKCIAFCAPCFLMMRARACV